MKNDGTFIDGFCVGTLWCVYCSREWLDRILEKGIKLESEVKNNVNMGCS
ncbi:unnamed protein product [marine sediment metagenome]|uniref:Uncharacterized protein n=1 Tax=marine sediment metagenome TaxID=412755 RepID=X1GML6_9ZZZZ